MPRRQPWGWGRRLLLLALLGAGLTALAPTIVFRTPLRDPLLHWAAGRLNLRLEAEGASAGWLTPVTLRAARLQDGDGKPLCEADSLTLDRTLVDLLRNSRDLGTIKLERPRIAVHLREDGSNWEDALRPLLQRPSTGPPPRLRLEFSDGEILLQDDRRMRTWTAAPLQLAVALTPGAEAPLTLDMQAAVTDGASQGQFALRLVQAESTAVQADLKTSQLPLSLLEGIAARLAPGLLASGQLDSDLSLVWRDGEVAMTIASLNTTGLVVRPPGMGDSEALRMDQLEVRGNLNWADGRVTAEQVSAVSDLASLTLNGDLAAPGGAAWWRLGERDQLELAGQVDLARLSRMFPRTLRIKDNTQIESGRLEVALASDRGGVRQWSGRISAVDIAATANGRPVRWDKPVVIDFQASQAGDAWSVKNFSCESSFLQLGGSGTAAAGQLDLRGDLNQLRQQLAQLIELPSMEMAGEFSGNLHWQQGARGVESRGAVALTQFQLSLPGRAAIQEEQLQLDFQLNGQLQGRRRLDQGQLRVDAGPDQLSAQLLRPVENLELESAPIRVELSGDIDRWLRRAGALLGRPEWRGDGAVSLTADLGVSAQQLAVDSSTLDAAPCRVRGMGMDIDEPRLAAQIRGAFDFKQRRWTGGESTVSSSTVAARCDNLLIQLGPAPVLSGNIGYAADVTRVCQLWATPGVAPERIWGGKVDGQAQLVQQNGAIRFQLRQRIQNATLSTLPKPTGGAALNRAGWQQVWQEPFVDIDASGAWLSQEGIVQIDKADIAADALNFTARGRLTDIAARMQAELEGQLSYDWQRLAGRLRPLIGDSLTIQGAGQSPITLRGPLRPALANPGGAARNASASAAAPRPLAPPELQAAASLSWQSATVEGIQIGPGALNTRLDQSILRFEAIDIPVSGGKIHLAPLLDLRGASPLLQSDGPQTMAQLEITPEMCGKWLKYVAPMMADAAQVEGKFSASVDQLSLPLGAPHSGSLRGAITLHTARVGPGPLSQKFLGVARQAEAMLKSARDGQTGAVAKLKNLDIDTAIQTLESGALFDSRGRLDPRKALGGLLGAPPAAAPAANPITWLSVPEHTVGFQLQDGRVYHQGMRMIIDGVEVRTSGAVGLDQSLQLEAEIPILDKWIGDSPALAGLRGQMLKVPVRGSLREPRLDSSAIGQLGQQLLASAAAGFLPTAGGAQGTAPGGAAAPGNSPSFNPLPNALPNAFPNGLPLPNGLGLPKLPNFPLPNNPLLPNNSQQPNNSPPQPSPPSSPPSLPQQPNQKPPLSVPDGVERALQGLFK